ncbi:MAG TPA: hypothetical protein VJ225_07875 [Nitrososphaeraceae archaeon]|nr:hypothetical protein [Nitrososphaeraceae archaeon]
MKLLQYKISTQIVVVLLAAATMIVVGVAAPQLAEAQTQTSENNAAIDDDSLNDLDIDQILEKFNIGGLDLGALLG